MARRRRATRASKGYAYLGAAAGSRGSRRRGILRGIALGGLAIVLACMGYGVSRLADWAHNSDTFVIKEIHVVGNRTLAVSAVAAAARIDAGTNLLHISPQVIERSVSALPEVKRAFVQKRLPGQLVIRVAERRPSLLLNCGGLWLVDREGVVLGRGSARDMERFTMVSGLALAQEGGGAESSHCGSVKGAASSTGSPKEAGLADGGGVRSAALPRLEPGARLERQGVDRTLAAVRAIGECAPDLPSIVSEICHTPGNGMMLVTSDPPHRVLLGCERPMAESLVALGPVLDDLKRRGLVGMEVDLRFKRQLVVRAPEGRVAMREES